MHPVDKRRKRALLADRIRTGNWRQVLVFTRTKHGANRLAAQLDKDGIRAAAIHGNKSQGARTRALADFKAGKVRALVATDIAARGLDIDKLPHVVNFELPNVPEDYVHRIGRTARAGEHGSAMSLVSDDERHLLVDIERLLKTEIPKEFLQGYEPEQWSASKPKKTGSKKTAGRRRGHAPKPIHRNGGTSRGANPGRRRKRPRHDRAGL